MNRFIQRFIADEAGATAIEYGLLVALIAVVIISVIGRVGTALSTKFTTVATSL
jgi:pilus assembly protein Flp/PilA